jgi:hypothetical protein
MGATNVGVRRTHPLFVVTVLTPATTETEDSPAVSSCPTIYIATRVPCKTRVVDEYEVMKFLLFFVGLSLSEIEMGLTSGRDCVIISMPRE